MQSNPAACTIAGSDSGGGAGIQADLKTFSAIGVWGTTVITALTAQNTQDVYRVCMVPEAMVAAQLEAVMADFDIRAFKTGMLGSAAIIRTVDRVLPPRCPLVVDPVMVATSGARLLDEGAGDELIGTLLPRATVVTPNIPEAVVLSGMEISTIDEMREAALAIMELGPEYVLVKGGHLEGAEVVDLLVGPGPELVLSGARYPHDVHGSGCCFSAAITAYLALGCTVPEAFREGKAFIAAAIREAVVSKSGRYSVNPPRGRSGKG
ncbi:MAG TPA: bifunctional hydroxymethylpyrimidine kinase/phosphomethylpyrimidine kinase [Methanoregulaceae archaeon]|nr:MAG: bifunctional hydroxymethylpyrimidine kinase/phosphomethylpyrimidine kinase [Methanolinea sp.]HON80963.1 bifunctional hydroxymethylpyrimidine kinase/phosphomethylpyrimidine kinase [Methanoregulaceae archaeon]HPD09730.1 bifunctional hydroxymethylpyrimidine kinase/phosphomethylpyrimidine kinase [Methanoregulaceae archaeon]HRT14549.1 bifunctional hydroxymethylpyrimidine kinase/phosphomethylpyrimidine kinase [Methanoregulaceae archaeon]HRU30120.1 bifunctional hydroxymethylpyrimidine kinase/p